MRNTGHSLNTRSTSELGQISLCLSAILGISRPKPRSLTILWVAILWVSQVVPMLTRVITLPSSVIIQLQSGFARLHEPRRSGVTISPTFAEGSRMRIKRRYLSK